MRRTPNTRIALAAGVCVLAAVAAACGGGSSSSSGGSSAGSAPVPQVTVSDLTADFSAMKSLQGLAAQGKGKVGVLLPDTTSSTRYVQYDAPYLKQAFEAAGLSSSDFKVDNAQGKATTMQYAGRSRHHRRRHPCCCRPARPRLRRRDREERRVEGRQGDRLRPAHTGGPADRYYVSFNNVQVGKLIGQGVVDCITTGTSTSRTS